MLSVCPKHVKNGLDVLDVPHVYKLEPSEDQKKTCKCQFCRLKAHYKLDSYSNYPKKQQDKH